MTQRSIERHRAKTSVTLDPVLLQAVDAFIEEHPVFDRSNVVDQALHLWYARQQERAMEEQFATPQSAVEQAERTAWGLIRNGAAARRYGLR